MAVAVFLLCPDRGSQSRDHRCALPGRCPRQGLHRRDNRMVFDLGLPAVCSSAFCRLNLQ
jgi:hypothetical protein